MRRAKPDDLLELAEGIRTLLAEPTPERIRRDTAGWPTSRWRLAAETAGVLGVGPLLYELLSRGGALTAADSAFVGLLARRRAHCRARGRALAADVRRVLALSALMDVPVVLVGDTALALGPDGDEVARHHADAHLLIRAPQETRFTAALARAGWRGIVRRVTPALAIFAEHPCDEGADDHEVVRLHLHTSVDFRAAGIHFDLSWAYWYEARPRLVLGVPALVPSPLRLLQYLLARASDRLMSLALPLADLWNLRLAGGRLGAADWATLVEEGVNQGEARLFWTPLLLAERAFGPAAPAAVLAELRREVPARLREWAEGATIADWAVRRFHPDWPASWDAWYRTAWERTLAARRLLLPLPSELTTPSPARGYARHLCGLVSRVPRLLRATRKKPAAAPTAGTAAPSVHAPATAAVLAIGGDAPRVRTAARPGGGPRSGSTPARRRHGP